MGADVCMCTHMFLESCHHPGPCLTGIWSYPHPRPAPPITVTPCRPSTLGVSYLTTLRGLEEEKGLVLVSGAVTKKCHTVERGLQGS